MGILVPPDTYKIRIGCTKEFAGGSLANLLPGVSVEKYKAFEISVPNLGEPGKETIPVTCPYCRADLTLQFKRRKQLSEKEAKLLLLIISPIVLSILTAVLCHLTDTFWLVPIFMGVIFAFYASLYYICGKNAIFGQLYIPRNSWKIVERYSNHILEVSS